MKKPMLWGYFFTHNAPGLLGQAKDELIKKGYEFVDIHLSDKEQPDEPDVFWLHMQKREIHTPQTLDIRHSELYVFANILGLDSYDGIDVGPIE